MDSRSFYLDVSSPDLEILPCEVRQLRWQALETSLQEALQQKEATSACWVQDACGIAHSHPRLLRLFSNSFGMVQFRSVQQDANNELAAERNAFQEARIWVNVSSETVSRRSLSLMMCFR